MSKSEDESVFISVERGGREILRINAEIGAFDRTLRKLYWYKRHGTQSPEFDEIFDEVVDKLKAYQAAKGETK